MAHHSNARMEENRLKCICEEPEAVTFCTVIHRRRKEEEKKNVHCIVSKKYMFDVEILVIFFVGLLVYIYIYFVPCTKQNKIK